MKKISKEEKKHMIPLLEDEVSKYGKAKLCHICNQTFNTNQKVNITITLRKLEIIVIIQVIIEVQHILYVIEDIEYKTIYQ